jgi:hypothetical protein
MSKKSRRRNRRILKALGAGLALAGLGGAFKKRPSGIGTGVGGGRDAAEFKEKAVPAKVYQDAILRGGVGVKPGKLRFGQVVDKKGDIKTIKPFESAGLTFGGVKTNKTKTQRAVDLANKEMSQGKLPPQLRIPGRTNITTKQGENRRAIKNALSNVKNFFTPNEASKNFGLGIYDMKDGGRVKKRKGAAKRGFGRAFKGGK